MIPMTLKPGEIDIHEFIGEEKPRPALTEEELDPATDPGFTPAALKSFNHVIDLLKRKQVPKKRIRELMIAINSQEEEEEGVDGQVEDQPYDETFDMEKEVAEVLKSVRLLRKSILTPSGRGLKTDVTVGEAKDVISMSNSMINTLMKSHEKIVNMARYRAVEQATVDVLRDLDGSEVLLQKLDEFQAAGKVGEGPLVTAFMSSLEARLDK